MTRVMTCSTKLGRVVAPHMRSWEKRVLAYVKGLGGFCML